MLVVVLLLLRNNIVRETIFCDRFGMVTQYISGARVKHRHMRISMRLASCVHSFFDTENVDNLFETVRVGLGALGANLLLMIEKVSNPCWSMADLKCRKVC